MSKRIGTGFALLASAIVLIGTLPSLLHAEETTIEKAGSRLGVSAGNVIFLPAKAISTSMGVVLWSVIVCPDRRGYRDNATSLAGHHRGPLPDNSGSSSKSDRKATKPFRDRVTSACSLA